MDPLLLMTGDAIEVGGRVTYGSIAMLGMYVVMTYLRCMAWGRHVYATGDDLEAARLTGIRTNRVLVSVYGRRAYLRHRGLVPDRPHRVGQPAVRPHLQPRHDHGRGHRRHQPVRWPGRDHRDADRRHHRGHGPQRPDLGGVDPLWQNFAVGMLVIVAVALDQWIRRVCA